MIFSPSNPGRQSPPGPSAFTRLELVLMIALGAVLISLLLGYTRRTTAKVSAVSCVGNLRQLGAGVAMYTIGGDAKLPYASLVFTTRAQSTWDTLISPVIRAEARRAISDPNTAAPGKSFLNPLLLCPSDPVPPAAWAAKNKLPRRSYAITRHNMSPQNWPPSANNATGIGLSWTFGSYGTNPPSAKVYNFEQTNRQAAVRFGMILKPAETLLLTERAWSNNIVGNASGAWIDRTSDHTDASALAPDALHQGRFNYLMLDGHVETLFPHQAVGADGEVGEDARKHLGPWTIRADD
ncbi:MAG: hypothetical protein FD161_1535 [Limisphaerales bacterium]|nr:MAG: hypothetical protein FD161_1535 [Limisphaerales bacterium]KAG0509349.1 MAG: hypothetical protein E1N63_1454 [Limisphaerales bacterium]TXT52094.1 MAG: hypothetical protein FD140_1027 [Limisphaerales bacterium]